MQITVTGRQVEITDPLRDYATDKAGKMTRYFDRIPAIEVVASKVDHRNYDLEMITHVEGHDHFVAHARGEDLYALIDQVHDKMERQLTDHKERLRNRKHPPASA